MPPTVAAKPIADRPAIPLVDLPKDPETEVARAPAGAPDPVPRAPEPPTSENEARFKIPISCAVEQANLGPVDRIPAEAIGIPGNAGTGGVGPVGTAALDRSPQTRVQGSPAYPPEARKDGRSGEVLVEFVVDETGRVLAPHVVKSTDRVFEDAALRAVERWQFVPGTVRNRAVRFRMAVPIVFRLDD